MRDSQVRRWIACVLEFRCRHRVILQPNRWTELFFLDEAAALAAGHRPCAECRHADYARFRAAWQVAHGYVACRLFKNISYGHAGLTNSAAAQELFDGELLYSPDTYDLFVQGHALLLARAQFERHSHALRTIVRERHTYVNRINAIMAALP